MLKRWTGPAPIAWCPTHGLHGARDRCFECDEPVEQIRMVSIEELCEQVKAELRGCNEHGWLAGSLGDAIAREAGMAIPEFVTPEHIAAGICSWLKDFGPREDDGEEGAGPDDSPGDAGETGGGQGSRAGGPSTSQVVCICTDADDPSDHRKDCPMWGRP